MIVDGSGGEPFQGSLLIVGDEIAGVGNSEPIADAQRFDASGCVVSPGFIDLHTHSDVSALSDPDCVSAVWQGITTQIVGHCGFSAAPTDDKTRESLRQEEPVFGFPGADGAPTVWGWDSTAEYLDTIELTSPRTNVGTLVGHNTLRRLAVGSEDRPPTPEETQLMARLARSSIEQGAMGVSTGLSYPPGLYARFDEIVAIAKEAGLAGRSYHTHMRYGGQPTIESLEEALATGRAADTHVNVSHLYPSTSDPVDEARAMLDLIDDENARGGKATFDLTLFTRGGGAFSQSLPRWALAGGLSVLVERLNDPEHRRRLSEELKEAERDWDDDQIVKVGDRSAAWMVGITIGGFARDAGLSPADGAVELLRTDPQFWVAPTIKRQEDLDTLLQHKACVPVTDGMSAHPVEHSHLGLMPKTFGTFPLLFGDYVRDRGVIGLPEAVAKATSIPAGRLGIRNRGRLASGKKADVVVFSEGSIANEATEKYPSRKPAGIRDVMVNGSWAMQNGCLTAERAGVAIR